MRILPFLKYSPCGNTTILVRNVPLSPAERARAAAEMIASGHLEAEQAGYADTEAALPRLDMMGGEFCVNATRAFAAQLFEEGRLTPEGEASGGVVSVSGMPERLRVRVRRVAPGRFESAVLLDLPEAPPLERVAPGIHLVRVPGIAHLVLDATAHPLPVDKDRDTAALFARFGLLDEDAAGCIWLRRGPSGPSITLCSGPRNRDDLCGNGLRVRDAGGVGRLPRRVRRCGRTGSDAAGRRSAAGGAGRTFPSRRLGRVGRRAGAPAGARRGLRRLSGRGALTRRQGDRVPEREHIPEQSSSSP